MKKKRWLSLLLCVLLLAGMGFSWLPVQSSADTSITPVVCISSQDGKSVYNRALGIPLQNRESCLVVLPVDFYEGDSLEYYLMLGDSLIELTNPGTTNTYLVMTAQTNATQYFYPGLTPVEEGETYAIVAYTSDGEIVSRPVTVTGIGSPDSDGMYPLSLQCDSSGMQALAAIVLDDYLVGFVGTNGAYAFVYEGGGGGSGSGSGGSRGGSGSGSSSGRRNQSNGILIAGAVAAAVIVVFLLLRKKGGDTLQSVTPEPGVPDSSYVPPTPHVPHTPSGPSPHTPNGTGFRLYLEATSGPNMGQMWQITEQGLLLGRSPEANILYPPDTKGVSRRHCKVFFTGGGLSVMDLGSTSGTYIRGKGKLLENTPVQLQAGDTIYLGSKKVALRLIAKS